MILVVEFSVKRDILKQNSYSKKSKKLLFTTFNCAKSQLIPLQDMKGIKNDDLIMALTGLGGGCGALSGALMALGLKYALHPKNTEPDKLKNIYRAMDSEFFKMAKILVSKFIKEFEYLECKRITATKFRNWDEFSGFRSTSFCDKLNEFLVKDTVEIIGVL